MNATAMRAHGRTVAATALEILAGIIFAIAWLIGGPPRLLASGIRWVAEQILDAADQIDPLPYCSCPKRRRR
jgi:hypothetical protein